MAAPQVDLQTTLGTIRIELDAEKAPLSAANFLSYVKSGHYDGTVFHRVIKGFMIQGGGYAPGFEEKETRAPIKNEAANGLSNKIGTIASVGVCTRPTEYVPCPAAMESACVPLMPTSQSDSLRALAAR